MTAMSFTTGTFSLCLCYASDSEMFVFRHGDDFVVSGTRPKQMEFEKQSAQTSHRQALSKLGTVYSTWRRQRGQDLEQGFEMGQTSVQSRT